MKKLLLLLFLAAPVWGRPIVIAHRGASGYLPEHTLPAYTLAIEQGADFIEPDLVPTKDGVLVCRHENVITDTTDVADRPEFRDRKRTKTIDGHRIEGWFTEDFTLQELKTLKARGRNRESHKHDGQYPIATFQEALELAVKRNVGIYPETKHPSYFRSIGKPLEERMVEQLHAAGFKGKDAKAYIQSFEVGNLRRLKEMTELPLMQLVDEEGAPADGERPYSEMITPEGLREIASYARGVAPPKKLAIRLIPEAHKAGLLVHSWTFRAENEYLPPELRSGDDKAGLGDLTAEVKRFFEAGLDGVFANHPDKAVAALKK